MPVTKPVKNPTAFLIKSITLPIAFIIPGNLFTNTFTYAIPNNINDIIFDINNIKVVAFVTENQLGDIITGTGCDVTYPTPPPSSVFELLPIIKDNIIYDIYGRVVTDIKKNTIYIRDMKKFIQF